MKNPRYCPHLWPQYPGLSPYIGHFYAQREDGTYFMAMVQLKWEDLGISLSDRINSKIALALEKLYEYDSCECQLNHRCEKHKDG
jgi:hypothetical protein